MASRLGPLYSLQGVARKDWTSSLPNSDTQIVIEANAQAFVVETFSESFHTKVLESLEPQWIFIGQVLREDEEIYYAFESSGERTLFDELRSIDGIGPKSAALLVGRLGLKGFREILENPKSISNVKVPGLGPKSLEKMSLGLKQKKEHYLGIVGTSISTPRGATSTEFSHARSDLEKALVGLGLKAIEAKNLFEKMCEENPAFEEMPLTQLLQEALKWWGKSRSHSTNNTNREAGV